MDEVEDSQDGDCEGWLLVRDPDDGSTVRTIEGPDVGVNEEGSQLGLTVGVSEGDTSRWQGGHWTAWKHGR